MSQSIRLSVQKLHPGEIALRMFEHSATKFLAPFCLASLSSSPPAFLHNATTSITPTIWSSASESLPGSKGPQRRNGFAMFTFPEMRISSQSGNEPIQSFSTEPWQFWTQFSDTLNSYHLLLQFYFFLRASPELSIIPRDLCIQRIWSWRTTIRLDTGLKRRELWGFPPRALEFPWYSLIFLTRCRMHLPQAALSH